MEKLQIVPQFEGKKDKIFIAEGTKINPEDLDKFC